MRMIVKRLEWFVVLFLSGLFLYAGVIKILDTRQLYQDIQSYRILPDLMAWWMAHYLPWLEVVTALGLLWPRVRLVSAAMIGALILAFMVALLSAWFRGLDVSCGCFGASADTSRYGWWLLRDLGLLLLAGLVLGKSRANAFMPAGAQAEGSSINMFKAEAE